MDQLKRAKSKPDSEQCISNESTFHYDLSVDETFSEWYAGYSNIYESWRIFKTISGFGPEEDTVYVTSIKMSLKKLEKFKSYFD